MMQSPHDIDIGVFVMKEEINQEVMSFFEKKMVRSFKLKGK